MITITRFCIFILISISIQASLYSQKLNTEDKAKFSELIDHYYDSSDFFIKEKVTDSILRLSRSADDSLRMMTGYFLKSTLYDDERILIYSDSIIDFFKKSPTKYQPASAYIEKGKYYYKKRMFKKSLDALIIAVRYTRDFDNENLRFSANYNIGLLKERVGEIEEAKKIYLNNLDYLYVHYKTSPYLMSHYFTLSNCYRELGQIDSSSYFISKGLKESIVKENYYMHSLFTLSRGLNYYQNGDIELGQEDIQNSISFIKENQDLPNMAVAYYFLGKTNFKLNQKKEGISNLSRVDSVFNITNDLHPKLRPAYEHLITHYSEGSTTDDKKAFYYVKQLIKLDSIIASNTVYLNKKLLKKYDLPQLLAKRDELIKDLSDTNTNKTTMLQLMCISILIIILYYFFQRKKWKGKYKAVLVSLENELKPKKSIEIKSKKDINLSPELKKLILDNLKEFEDKEGYLKNNVTTHSLAKEINTNSKYLSQIVNHRYGYSFTRYLNTLRINYAIKRLDVDPRFRKYTIKAIAQEIGFAKADSFNRVFKKITGMPFSLFLKELNKEKISI